MVLLLKKSDVASLVAGPDLMRRVIDVIEASFRDVATWSGQRDPTVFPTDLTRPKLYTIMGAAQSQNAIGGALHLRGGSAGMGAHSSFKLTFDLTSGDLLCLLEDGPIHRYMHGADMGVATRWLAREDARVLTMVTAGDTPKTGDPDRDAAISAANARGAIITMATIGAICAVRPIEDVVIASSSKRHEEEVATHVATELGIAAQPAASLETAVRDADVVSLCTNNLYRGAGDAGVDVGWLSPGTHVNVVIRGEVTDDFVRACKLFPASVAELYAIEPPWEPFASLAAAGEVEMPAGLDEVVAKTKPGRTAPDDLTLFTGASIGAQHAALAAWVYDLALERGVGTQWELEG